MSDVFLIAEIGSVHDGSIGNAKKLVDLAVDCGADAVKFQTHFFDKESLPKAPGPSYFSSETRADYFQRTAFSPEQWFDLFNHCKSQSIEFMSSPFSLEAAIFLDDLGMSKFKIPSGEVTNLPLLETVAAMRKPVILSTGMSDWAEIDRAFDVLKRTCDVSVLQCSSSYPCPPEKVGLNVLQEMRLRYGCPVGLSDHTLSNSAAIAAVAMGASVIEKHLTFSKMMYGSDAQHSAEPEQFRQLAKAIREVSMMLGNPINKNETSDYSEMKKIFQKSIVFAKDLDEGTVLDLDCLAFKKPGDGMSAGEYKRLIGRKTTKKCFKDEQVAEDCFR